MSNGNFKKANECLRNGHFGEALGYYRQLMIGSSRFPYYPTNAAQAAEALDDPLRAACLKLQAYLIDSDRADRLVLAATAAGQMNQKNDSELVLVVVPVFNAAETLSQSILSILEQTYENIIVIAVDDNSSDDSYSILMGLESTHQNLYTIRNAENVGAFRSANLAMFVARNIGFGFFLKHDADDSMLPDKIQSQVRALQENPSAQFCTTGYRRIDPTTRNTINTKPRGHNMTLYRASVFGHLGYFDSSRFGADSEYLERALAKFGPGVECHVADLLTIAHASPQSLTAQIPLGSDRRLEYQTAYRAKHAAMRMRSDFRRASDVHDAYVRIVRSTKPVICGIATLLNRKDALRDTVESILPQVDKLIVYQNGYRETFDFLTSPKVEVISSLDTGIDMGDAGKFYRLGEYHDAFYFSIDDDLIYPQDYVDHLLDILVQHDERVIVSAHGRVMVRSPKSYYKDKIKVFHFEESVELTSPCHFGGTGVMAFSTTCVKIDFSDFKFPNMADVWMGLHARAHNIPILVARHPAGWMRHSDKFDVDTTIFRTNESSPATEHSNKLVEALDFSLINTSSGSPRVQRQAKVIKFKRASHLISTDFLITVAIPTFNRPEMLARLVAQLDEAAKCFRVRLVIFDDGSNPPVEKSRLTGTHFESVEIFRYENHGKKKYWQLVNIIFDKLSTIASEYYVYLGDDLEVAPEFFSQVVFNWVSIKDPQKVSLNLLRDARLKSWTNFERIDVKFGDFAVSRTQWLDMIMVFDRRLLEYRLEPVPATRWSNNPLLSSGVGAQLSSRLNDLGFSMYQVMSSLVRHEDHESQMNPEERRINPLTDVTRSHSIPVSK
ncbi:MAG: hypothetical protein RJA70_1832 [Pseudomonadota bacterium]|jgi:glycosyltransferase involved in cell wall biosynthesis